MPDKPKQTCEWKQENDPRGVVYYETKCGNALVLLDELKEPERERCPYCGGRIKLVKDE